MASAAPATAPISRWLPFSQICKQRGLLDSTLVIWGGEFGRLPNGQMSEGNKRGTLNIEGRDHNSKAFSLWLAGGGIKGGTVYGATDELGFGAVENPVSVADFHATILHQLGFDYKQLYYELDGQRERLTANFAGESRERDSRVKGAVPAVGWDAHRFRLASPESMATQGNEGVRDSNENWLLRSPARDDSPLAPGRSRGKAALCPDCKAPEMGRHTQLANQLARMKVPPPSGAY